MAAVHTATSAETRTTIKISTETSPQRATRAPKAAQEHSATLTCIVCLTVLATPHYNVAAIGFHINVCGHHQCDLNHDNAASARATSIALPRVLTLAAKMRHFASPTLSSGTFASFNEKHSPSHASFCDVPRYLTVLVGQLTDNCRQQAEASVGLRERGGRRRRISQARSA